MRWILVIILAVTALHLMPHGQAHSCLLVSYLVDTCGPNNGSFEECANCTPGQEGQVPDGWSAHGPAFNGWLFGTARTGVSSFWHAPGTDLVSETYSVQPGTAYEVSAWYRVKEFGDAHTLVLKAYVMGNTVDTQIFTQTYTVTDPEWAEATMTVTAPGESWRAWIMVQIFVYSGEGEGVVVDDVSIHQV